MDSEDKIHDHLEITSKCEHDVLLKNEEEFKPTIYLPKSLLKAITKNFSDGVNWQWRVCSGLQGIRNSHLPTRLIIISVKTLVHADKENVVTFDCRDCLKVVDCSREEATEYNLYG
jgi:hypothetical protein